jgi:hypothetical protein
MEWSRINQENLLISKSVILILFTISLII